MTSPDQLLVLSRQGQPNKSIQALISNRALNRKKLILDYLGKHRICTKYDLTREIRTHERAEGLVGAIDAKTTKRMLHALEREKKLRTFEVSVKNVSYMCVCVTDIDESDEIFKNYCSTFRRTFDSVDLKVKNEAAVAANSPVDESNDHDESVVVGADDELPQPPPPPPQRSTVTNTFKLTNSFIDSVVADLELLTQRKRPFGVVPKFQKAIILHRFIHYLLFFYDGVRQSVSFTMNTNFNAAIDVKT